MSHWFVDANYAFRMGKNIALKHEKFNCLKIFNCLMVLQLLPYLAVEIFYSTIFFLWLEARKRDSWECYSLAMEIFACLCTRRIEKQLSLIFTKPSTNGISDLMGFVIALWDLSTAFACTFMDAVFVFEELSISNNLSVKVKAGKKKILARKREQK